MQCFTRLIAQIVITLVIFEFGCRALDLGPPFRPQTGLVFKKFYRDPNGLVEMVPNWEGIISGNRAKTNSQGFFSHEHDPNKEAHACRVFVLGDSYTMGEGLPEEQLYTAKLETLLSRTGKTVFVYNMGISATNTLQQLETLRNEILKKGKRPHFVFLAFNINDYFKYKQTKFEELQSEGFRFRELSYGDVELNFFDQPFRLQLNIILQAAAGYRALNWAYQELAAGESRLKHIPQSKIEIEEMGRTIKDMQSLAHSVGSQFMVGILPALLETDRDIKHFRDYPHKELQENTCAHLSSMGITCFDLVPLLGDTDPNDMALSFWNRHYGDFGHTKIAEAIAAKFPGAETFCPNSGSRSFPLM